MSGPVYRMDVDARDFESSLDAFFGEIVLAAESAFFMEAVETIAEAQQETPVDEGVLRGSGHALLPERRGDIIEVVFGFGGPAGSGNVAGESNDEDCGYATHVHENLLAHHEVGNAKYLERPIERRKPDAPDRIARRMNRRMR